MNDKSQVKWRLRCSKCGDLFNDRHEGETCPGAFYKNCDGLLVFNDPLEYQNLITTLQAQLTQAQEDARLLRVQIDVSDAAFQQCRNQLKATESREAETSEVAALQLTCARKERDELSARCAVMRDALEGCNEMFDTYGHTSESPCVRDKEIVSNMLKALSTSAGAALLARLKEAEWLLQDPDRIGSVEWCKRYDAWLKEGAK